MLGRKTNLQLPTTSFVGRESELRLIRERLADARLVTLLGPPGIGKSRIALELAQRLLPQLPGGVWWCDLTAVEYAARLAEVIGRAVGSSYADRTPEALAGDLERRLRQLGRALLVLDNCESASRTAVEPLTRWLSSAPGLKVLATSRVRLKVAGEALIELGPLSLAQGASDVEPADAVRLFVERARAVRQDFVLDDPNAQPLAELVRQLDGIPLAIELAATRMSVLSPAELLERLPRRLELLQGADAAGRQRTLRSAIDWSFAHLTDSERSALAQCSVFRGGFTLAAAEAVLRFEQPGAPATLDVLQSLRESSLLYTSRPEHFPNELRFGLYLSIRDYAAEQLEAGGGAREVRLRAARWFAARGRQLAAAATGDETLQALRRLDLETDNLLAAHRSMLENGSSEQELRDAMEIAIALEPALVRHSLPTLLALLDAGLERWEGAAGVEIRARAMLTRARARTAAGRPAEGAADATEVLEQARRMRVKDLETGALGQLGYAMRRMGRLEEAVELLEQAIAGAEAMGDRQTENGFRLEVAASVMVVAKLAAAAEHLERAHSLAKQLADPFAEQRAISLWGYFELARGELQRAREAFERASELAQSNGDTSGAFFGENYLAHVQFQLGQLDAAIARARQARRLAEQHGLGGVSHSVRLLALMLFEQGAVDEAERMAIEGVATAERSADQRGVALALAITAGIEAARGKSAVHPLARSRELLARFGDPALRTAVELYARAVESPRDPLAGVDEILAEWGTRSPHVRDAAQFLRRLEAPRTPTAVAAFDDPQALTVGPEARWVRLPDGTVVQFSRGTAMRQMLRALAERRLRSPGRGMSIEELFVSGWPGERVTSAVAKNRVYVNLTRLRRMGLRGLIVSRDDGFLLDPAVPLRWAAETV